MIAELDDLPRAVREIENVFIPLADGCRLAARIWLPADAELHPAPALLEYIPYRKRDFMRVRDEPMHRYFAGHGYAAVRVDLRGSGDSDGVLADEYLPREQEDALQVIDWLARQPWCDGNVGMTGISWGGFNALQVAAHAPPALKAIITLCASDDRYADDAHYLGGCLLGENQKWGTVLFAISALPPDPELVGERWREMWRERLAADRPFPTLWLQHQRRDDYWAQGSVCEDFSRIRCPVYAIGGWADGYSNAVMRLLAGLEVPRKGLIGPWAHSFPHIGVPGPAIGYLQEARRWWDHWLRGRDNGIMAEPMLRVWMQERVEPEPFHDMRPGRWVAEPVWPRVDPAEQTFYLHATPSLEAKQGEARTLEICSPQTVGLAAGEWCGFGEEGEAPLDQRPDDGKSLVFDSAPLSSDVEILGAPELTLTLASDSPVAMLAVRLCDVASDGSSARVSFGVLNLTHRTGHAEPRPLTPGETVEVRISLNDIAHRFAAGNVVRVALSTAYWPMVWPPPQPATLTIHTAGSCLNLPVRAPKSLDAKLAPFAQPQTATSSSRQTPLEPSRLVRSIERDLIDHKVTFRLSSEGGDLEAGAVARIAEIDLEIGHTVERRFSVRDADPLSALTTMTERLMLRRGNWLIRVQADTEMTATSEHFRVRARLQARLGEEEFFVREWDDLVPRDLA